MDTNTVLEAKIIEQLSKLTPYLCVRGCEAPNIETYIDIHILCLL
jgi:hypothetical protein